MKRYNFLFVFFGMTFLLISQLFVGCKEDDSLEGAKEVYITIKPKDPFIMVGDTVPLSAEIVNLSGDVINTPVEWKSDDESIVKILDNKLLAQDGGQGKTTKVRATLKNGKYALINVTVTTHSANEVRPFVDTHYTYSKNNDTVWFVVDPIQLLLDFTPVIENSNPDLLVPNPTDPVYVDKETGKVGYVFSSSNTIGKGTITLLIGAQGSEKKGSTEVIVSPTIISTLGDDFNSVTYEMSKTMDVNSIDTVWVNTKVDPTYEIDLSNAEKLYNWKIDGNTAQMTDIGVKVVQDRGHRAFAILRSGKFTGQNVVHFECNGTKLTTTIDVQNYATQYPVDELIVDKYSVEIPVGSMVYITPSVKPVSSYGIHIPKFTPQNPSIVQIMGYNGSEMGIRGLSMGETDIVVTSNDKSVTIKVKVTESVRSVVLSTGNQNAIFEGQSTKWDAVVTTSGNSVVKPNWISNNPQIASIDTEGIISGIAPGQTSIVAEAGGVTSAPGKLSVIAIPSSDINYTEANTNMDGNAIVIEKGKVLIIIEPLSPLPFREMTIAVTPNSPVSEVMNATYSLSNSQMSIMTGGANARVTAGAVTVKNGDDEWSKKVEGEVTVTIGSKSFKVKLANVPAYF